MVALYIQINDMNTAYWPWEDINDNFYIYDEIDLHSSGAEGIPTFYISHSEGYVLVVGSNTGGGNWDDFSIRVRVYDNNIGGYVPGDIESWIGDASNQRLKFIIYRYSFAGDYPRIEVAVEYTYGGSLIIHKSGENWNYIHWRIDNFWLDNPDRNAYYVGANLETFNWPNPY